MFLIVSKYLIPKGYRSIAVFPFVILGTSEDIANPVLINHEMIHIRQQLELLVLPFFIWYILEYLLRWIECRSHVEAYKNISFEREAYNNEKSPGYLKSRPFWNFLKFI